MTIKQSEAVKAYQSIKDLNRQKLNSGKMAKQIYELTNKLKNAYDFQVQEEEKIYKVHPNFNPVIGGINVEGKTPEEKEEMFEEIKKIDQELLDISELDFEIDFEPFDMDLNQNSIKISGEDIGNLEKFINFI